MGGFLGGLASFLSPALTTATQAAGAYQGAESQASQMQQQQIIQALNMARQQKAQELQQALNQAQIAHLGAQTDQIQHPSPDLTPTTGTDADGRAVVYGFDKHSGTMTPTGVAAKPANPIFGSSEWEAAERAKAVIAAKYGYHAPRNIDPLSPEGLAAQLKLSKEKTTGKGGTGTAAQQMAGAQYSVAKDASPDIDAYKPSVVSRELSKVPAIGNTLVGWTDSNYQQLDRDSRQFIESYMHALGGRRVTQQEYERLKGIYIPEPGDTDGQLKSKAVARQTALRSMKRMSGPVGETIDAEGGQGHSPAPTPVKSKADAWEAYVNAGLSKAQATAKVQAEFPDEDE